MKPVYSFRLDDISWDMNYDNFCKIKRLFIQYNIRPLIGVIPFNEDIKIKSQVGMTRLSEEDFWPMVKDLQDNYGWSIALHGFNHVYVTSDSGLFKINKRAEFAGLPYEIQHEKIQKGIKILENHGLNIDCFMAPGHSLDWNTIKALKNSGIDIVTDGRCAYPYKKHEVFFIPQIGSWPQEKIWGVNNSCFHINTWNESTFDLFESFLKKHIDDCVDYSYVIQQTRNGIYNNKVFENIISHLLCKAYQSLKNMKAFIRKTE